MVEVSLVVAPVVLEAIAVIVAVIMGCDDILEG